MEEINKCSSREFIVCLRICKISVVHKYMQANILAEKIKLLSSLLEYLLAYCIHCYLKGLEMLEVTSLICKMMV